MTDPLLLGDQVVASVGQASSETDTAVESTSATRQIRAERSVHRIKWIYLEKENKSMPIVTQSENGPCPLLAIINALVISGKLKLTAGEDTISGQRLVDRLFEYMLETPPENISDAHKLDYERNVQDAFTIAPRLLTGLDVNVKFGGVSQFEYTPEMLIFDLVGVMLYHSWLIEPASSPFASSVAAMSYNQLMDKVISGHPDLPTGADAERVAAWERECHEVLAAREFLESTASQLTYHGLCELNGTLQDGQTCVFFRNNHFSTLHKYKGQLYLLVTDQGYLNEHQIVYESLDCLDGDSFFVDHNFERVALKTSSAVEQQAAPPVIQSQEDQDYLIALSLQQELSEQTPAVPSTQVAVPTALAPVAAPAPAPTPTAAATAAAPPSVEVTPSAPPDSVVNPSYVLTDAPKHSPAQVPGQQEDMDLQLALQLQQQFDSEADAPVDEQAQAAQLEENRRQQQLADLEQRQRQMLQPPPPPSQAEQSKDCILL